MYIHILSNPNSIRPHFLWKCVSMTVTLHRNLSQAFSVNYSTQAESEAGFQLVIHELFSKV